jgi:hypothetical protein
MPTIDTLALIGSLKAVLHEQIAHTDVIAALPSPRLTTIPSPGKWSVHQVIQHMNLSSGHYYRALQRVYTTGHSTLRFRATFTPGPIGQFCVNAMLPRTNGSIPMPMRTLRMFDPAVTTADGEDDPQEVLRIYRSMLSGMLDLLDQATVKGIEGPRVVSTLGPIIRFKVGDAFRFPIAHQQRHHLQIARIIQDGSAG